MSSTVRDRILDTASQLFHREGFRAVGIDRIVAESDVAKMSLYKHFPSKDDLIVAYLERRHNRWVEWFQTAADRCHTANSHMEAFFAALSGWIDRQEGRGCPFINASLELTDPSHPARHVVAEHRAFVRQFVAEQLTADGRTPTAALLEAIGILVDGANVRSAMGIPDAAQTAARLAQQIVDQARPSESPTHPIT